MSFSAPTKKIYNQQDLAAFRRSVAFERLHVTLQRIIDKIRNTEVPPSTLNLALVSRAIDNTTTCSLRGPEALPAESQEPQPNLKVVLNIFSTLSRLIDETPPFEGPRRFGNMACRVWHEKAEKAVMDVLRTLELPSKLQGNEFLEELLYYILNSFGSSVRLDYGTGHELSFLAFIGALFDYNILDYSKTTLTEILVMFSQYYDLVRRLILEYNLEPAGSHGVWGLDDHFHLIYILGAAQFTENRSHPEVSQVLKSPGLQHYRVSNLYVNAIAFIFRIKSGPFNEHSPILYDIHATVVLWSKVLQGLLKMYEVEVLGKVPVVQHFWFGPSLYPWVDMNTGTELPASSQEEENTLSGTMTTSTNILVTAAPWAKPSGRAPMRNIPGLRGPGQRVNVPLGGPGARMTPDGPGVPRVSGIPRKDDKERGNQRRE